MSSTKVREKMAGKMRSMRLLAVLLVSMIALIMGVAAPQAWATGFICVDEDGDPMGLDESKVFFEYSSSDEDLGIQFFWDGKPWKWMIVQNGNWRSVLSVGTLRNLRKLGLTEGFFESAEPGLCQKPDGEECTESEIEAAKEAFLSRFPEGTYKFKGMATEGCLLFGDDLLTHNLLDPVDLDLEDFPAIEWTEYGEVVKVEVVVELVVIIDDEEIVYKQTTTLPPGIEELTVSPEFVDLIEQDLEDDIVEELKVEVVVDEESGNRTITEEELCFNEPGDVTDCP
ncbi:MAG: hypothetical protein PVG40_08585 [Desulfobacterales bacterium]|jgi:hypothetical protein